MKYSKEGRRLHALAEQAREAGDFLKALDYTDQSTLAYQKDQDLLGLSEIQSSRQSTFKQLFRQTNDPVFLILEKHAAESAVEIAEKSGIKEALGIPYYNLGKYHFKAGDFQKAAGAFKKAVENLTAYPGIHTRQSVIADIKGHQYAVEYQCGDKSALSRALEALKELETAQEDSLYNRNVWISGAHLRIAEMLLNDDKLLAKEHLDKAQ